METTYSKNNLNLSVRATELVLGVTKNAILKSVGKGPKMKTELPNFK